MLIIKSASTSMRVSYFMESSERNIIKDIMLRIYFKVKITHLNSQRYSSIIILHFLFWTYCNQCKHRNMPFCMLSVTPSQLQQKNTVDGFIFVGTNFHGLNKNHTFVGFKICGHSIFLQNSYRKFLFRGYLISWIRPSTKTTKIGTPRKLSHPQ